MSPDRLAIVGLTMAVTADAFGNMMPNMAQVYQTPYSPGYARGVRLTAATAAGAGLAVGAIVSIAVKSHHSLLFSLLISAGFIGAYEYALRHGGDQCP